MLREPLLHFVVLGLGLFLLWGLVGEDAGTLVVTEATVARLKADEARRRGREPTDQELDAVLRRWVDDELLYREGLELGLDRADPVVRRRVVQKMRFLHEDLRTPGTPDAAALAQIGEGLGVPPRASFEHVYLRDESELAAAQAALEGGADPATIGAPFALGRTFEDRALSIVSRDFGADFATVVETSPPDAWSAALSPFGAHLVRVTNRTESKPLTGDAARARALEIWTAEQRARGGEDALEELRSRTPVVIER